MHIPWNLFSYAMHQLRSRTCRINNQFVIDFRTNVLCNRANHPEFGMIGQCRSELQRNDTLLESSNYGAGSRTRMKNRTVGRMAKAASVSPGSGRILFHCARHYQPEYIIELGTATGISTMYLAMGNPGAKVITLEGNPQLGALALENFAKIGLNNITLINGEFDNTIERIIPEIKGNSLVFIDGNHTHDATWKYFEIFAGLTGKRHILIFDDIRWSAGMTRAWKKITRSPQAGLALDLFHMGIIFKGMGTCGQKFRL